MPGNIENNSSRIEEEDIFENEEAGGDGEMETDPNIIRDTVVVPEDERSKKKKIINVRRELWEIYNEEDEKSKMRQAIKYAVGEINKFFENKKSLEKISLKELDNELIREGAPLYDFLHDKSEKRRKEIFELLKKEVKKRKAVLEKKSEFERLDDEWKDWLEETDDEEAELKTKKQEQFNRILADLKWDEKDKAKEKLWENLSEKEQKKFLERNEFSNEMERDDYKFNNYLDKKAEELDLSREQFDALIINGFSVGNVKKRGWLSYLNPLGPHLLGSSLPTAREMPDNPGMYGELMPRPIVVEREGSGQVLYRLEELKALGEEYVKKEEKLLKRTALEKLSRRLNKKREISEGEIEYKKYEIEDKESKLVKNTVFESLSDKEKKKLGFEKNDEGEFIQDDEILDAYLQEKTDLLSAVFGIQIEKSTVEELIMQGKWIHGLEELDGFSKMLARRGMGFWDNHELKEAFNNHLPFPQKIMMLVSKIAKGEIDVAFANRILTKEGKENKKKQDPKEDNYSLQMLVMDKDGNFDTTLYTKRTLREFIKKAQKNRDARLNKKASVNIARQKLN